MLCAEEVEPWLTTQWQTANRKIAYILGRGRAYTSDMSSTSGYMGVKYVQEVGSRFLDMSYCPKGVTFTKGVGFLLSDGSSQRGL